MTSPINGLGNFQMIPEDLKSRAAESRAPQQGSSFHERLLDSLAGTNAKPHQIAGAIGNAPVDGDVTRAEALIDVKNADLSLQMMLQMRHKLLEAYNEIKDIRM